MKLDKTNLKDLFYEFCRYLLVGGLATLIDFGVLFVCHEYLIKADGIGLYISTALGFTAGLIFNYIMSLVFVFRKQKDKGKGLKAFLIFLFVGMVGLVLTELGMWLGVNLLHFNYLLVKVFVTGAVLLWNYLGRKILIFER
ncbi:GtrA family protein [Candidatus Soleaferrea massiliensis]|uniref:GtrA family protein n=1 Tax=Candidatus Soleaferrea massiliensis TaxID=1470354 RepID=UPI00059086BD|nr:GtrA family protein [Candidatus Soleaferrea massiliensis]